MRRKLVMISLVALIVVAGVGSLSAYLLMAPRSPADACPSPLAGQAILRSQLPQTAAFGPVATFGLPDPPRSPNAIAVGPDGSVWFGEQAVPGIGHLYPNGQLVEYEFPGKYAISAASGYTCSRRTDIWGIAQWDGRIWATDGAKGRLLALNPVDGSFESVTLPKNGSFPYTMTVGPDNNSIWFTQISSGQIGTLFSNGTLIEHDIHEQALQLPSYLDKNGTGASISLPGAPAEVAFANTSVGYYVDVSPAAKNTCVFQFDPRRFVPQVLPVGGNHTLYSPDSIALGDGGFWVAQHGSSDIAYYDLANGTWSTYPTSRVPYATTTLPYFVRTNHSMVWFNEHFGNRMAALDLSTETLTEYSVSNPPAGNLSQIQSALTFALDRHGAWFTELTGNRIGYVDASAKLLPFSVSATPGGSKSIGRGEATTISVRINGSSLLPLDVRLSGSEQSGRSNSNGGITLNANITHLATLSGERDVSVTLQTGATTPPGRYIEIITVTDGLISRSVYFGLTVV